MKYLKRFRPNLNQNLNGTVMLLPLVGVTAIRIEILDVFFLLILATVAFFVLAIVVMAVLMIVHEARTISKEVGWREQLEYTSGWLTDPYFKPRLFWSQLVGPLIGMVLTAVGVLLWRTAPGWFTFVLLAPGPATLVLAWYVIRKVDRFEQVLGK